MATDPGGETTAGIGVLSAKLRALVRRWFVQFNPLYFFSALCVLTGVFLAGKGLHTAGLQEAGPVLAGTLEVYQLSLIAGAAFLFRRSGQQRPAVILGIVAVVFFFDPTFQTEGFAASAGVGLAASLAWAALALAKLGLLSWALRLRLSATTVGLFAFGALGVSVSPHLLSRACAGDWWISEVAATAIATALPTMLLGLFVARPPHIRSVPLTIWGTTVLRRATRTAWMIWAGFYLYHALAWWTVYDLTPTIAHLAPALLLIALLRQREHEVWVATAAAVAVTLFSPELVATTAAVGAFATARAAHRAGRPRLYVGTVLLLFLSAWTVGWSAWPPPERVVAFECAAALVLLLLAWRRRLVVPLVIAYVWMVLQARAMLPPAPNAYLEWGITLLVIGFVALPAGLVVNLRLARP